MCYMNCKYERFNPVTGDCKCVSPKGAPCPHECVMCNYCDKEFNLDDLIEDDRCPYCKAKLYI